MDMTSGFGRLTRYTLDPQDGTLIDNSRKILLGKSLDDGFLLLHLSHGIGSLALGEDGSLLVSCDSQTYQWIDSQPMPGINRYRIRAYNTYGSFVSAQKAHSWAGPQGRDIWIYPQPATDMLNIAWLADAQERSVKLFDLQGNCVKTLRNISAEDDRTIIDISDLSAGMYIYIIEYDMKRLRGKWVKQ